MNVLFLYLPILLATISLFSGFAKNAQKALGILDFEDRQIVILHALTGMKHREIAELLDLPLGTVLSKYKRALEKMRKELEGKGESHER